MKYRAEIDGLRALAVVPVILFHAGFEGFSGGFVGVDVFFVISGYLITTILIEDLNNQRFSILHFYERRARRILPALFLVMGLTVPLAWFWMFPSQLRDFSESLVAVSLFVSNVLFWQESGYFDTAAELKPLLHTWSLAVEEQYYLLFPVFLFLVWRFGRTPVFWLLLVLAAVSLGLSEWGWRKAESANFYLAPTRAWELFAGSLAALIVQKRGVRANNALSLLGLGAIVFATLVYDSTTPFPSLYALVPVGGVVLLILFAGDTTLSARLLGTKMLVGIGLISYSAYLWHQPLFAFARIRSLNEPHVAVMVALTLASMGLAYLSWRFVEGPFRDRRRMSRGTVFAFSILGLLAFIGLGALGAVGAIRPSSDVTIDHITGWEDRSPCTIRGGLAEGQGADLREACFGDDNNIFLLGDSHAEAIGTEVRGALEAAGWNVISLFERGCLPILQTSRQPYQEKCVNTKEAYWDLIRSTDAPVIISASWRINLLGARFDNQEGGVDFGDSGLNVALEGDEEILTFVERSLAEIAGKRRVILVGQIPEAGWNVPERLAKIRRFAPDRLAEEITTSHAVYLSANAPVLEMFERLSGLAGLALVEPQARVCDTEVAARCLNTRAGTVLYRDEDHPSPSFATMIAADIVEHLGGN